MTVVPTDLKLRQASRVLEVSFADGEFFSLPFEYLRVFSPSAEVRGHGGGPLKLVPGKRLVNITAVEPVGHYAVKLTFDDGHDSGLYTWQTLHELGRDLQQNWSHYLARLDEAGFSREPVGQSQPVQHYKPTDD